MICYDIVEPKRLVKVSKMLEKYGVRSQYSFFQCDISKSRYDTLMRELLDLVDIKKDRLYSYPICDKCFSKIHKQGIGDILSIASFEII